MGNASYIHVDWERHVTSSGYATKGLHEVFRGRSIDPDLDPSKFRYREAVDSETNPETTPIILACDETGSMGELAHIIIQNALGGIMNALYTRKPVTNPQILCAGVGDAECDQAPIQVTQFEADGVNLSKQIEKIFIEGNGGGNNGESYPLVWFFAAYKTKCDAIRKRHRKGYIFTIGDECPLPTIKKEAIDRFFAMPTPAEADMNTNVLLADTQRDWHVFHLIIKPHPIQPVIKTWKKLLAERAVLVENVEFLAPGIVAIIEAVEGRSKEQIMHGHVGEEARIVEHVTRQLHA